MAVTFDSNKWVSNIFTLEKAGVEYTVKGSVAEGKETTDKSTVFNVEIPATYSYSSGTFKFYNNTTHAEITPAISTPISGSITATFAENVLTTGTEYKMTFDLTK